MSEEPAGAERVYYRLRWPDPEVPAGEPLWLFYEVDRNADAVLRTVDISPDGTITRNSIELEERHGDTCPSLIDCSLSDGFDGMDFERISASEFESRYANGEDKPFWSVR